MYLRNSRKQRIEWRVKDAFRASYINMLVMRIVLLKLKLIKGVSALKFIFYPNAMKYQNSVSENLSHHMKVSVRFQSE